MPACSDSPEAPGDYFKIHARRGAERYVEGCDTFEEALSRACRKLAKHPDMRIWITDAGNRTLLEADELRKRCGVQQIRIAGQVRGSASSRK
jgi:hypothetical protein